ncbi:MAG: tripartite tricarboxylate transporter substrate-binding protein [Comamonas sp.]
MSRTFRVTAIALAATVTALGASAQNFPADGKSITIVVPFAAGGPTDRVARDLAEAMRKPLGGTTVVIENLGGAGSSIGTAKVARANPDGYTLLVNHIGMSTMPTLYRKLAFDVLNDFEYLGIVNDVPMTVIGKPNLAANNFAELREMINRDKEKINIGHSGLGSAGHLCGLMFQSALGVQMTPVAYKGAAPAITDLMGGTIDLMCDQTTNTSSQIEAKKVKAYGVTTLQQLKAPALKDLPTLDSSGLKGFNVTVWHGLYAPKGTPAAVLTKLNEALKQAVKDPDFIRKQEGLGAVVVADNRVEPAEHKKFVAKEIESWGKVIKAAGQYAD